MFSHKRILTNLLCTLFVLSLLAVQPASLTTLSAQEAQGTIAYVSGISWDGIRLIEADGSNDRLLWTHGLDDQNDGYGSDPGIYNILSLAWRPDASELAFASTHERRCSLNISDIFVIGSDGSGYRRITQAPGCAALAGYPKGTVRVPVENPDGSLSPSHIYFQGALGAQALSLPPNGSGVVTFDKVADLGEGVMQRAILIALDSGDNREIEEQTAIDVGTDTIVETPPLSLSIPNYGGTWLTSPTWRSDGSAVGYLDGWTPRQLAPYPAPLAEGDLLVTTAGWPPGELSSANHLRWGPTSVRANQLLYEGKNDSQWGIMLVTEGSSTVGELLVPITPVDEYVIDLAWLPDGSGFLYALWEPAPEVDAFSEKSNLYEYKFAAESVRRLTDMPAGEYVGRLSISPDGQQIVFERTDKLVFRGGELPDPDLWIMNRDGSNMRLFVENGRAPAWSPQELKAPSAPPASTPTPTPTPTFTPSPTPSPSSTPQPSSTPGASEMEDRLYLPFLDHRH